MKGKCLPTKLIQIKGGKENRPVRADLHTRMMFRDIEIEKIVQEIATKKRDCNLCMHRRGCPFRKGYILLSDGAEYHCSFSYAYRGWDHEKAVENYKYRMSFVGKIHTLYEVIFEKIFGF